MGLPAEEPSLNHSKSKTYLICLFNIFLLVSNLLSHLYCLLLRAAYFIHMVSTFKLQHHLYFQLVTHSDGRMTGCFHICNATGILWGPLVTEEVLLSDLFFICWSFTRVHSCFHCVVIIVGLLSSRNTTAIVCKWDSGFSVMKAVGVGLGLEKHLSQTDWITSYWFSENLWILCIITEAIFSKLHCPVGAKLLNFLF